MRKWLTGLLVLVMFGSGVAFAAQLTAKRIAGARFLLAASFPENADRVCFAFDAVEPEAEPIGCVLEDDVVDSGGTGVVEFPEVGTVNLPPDTRSALLAVDLPKDQMHLVRAYAENAIGRSDSSVDVFVADNRLPDVPRLLELVIEKLDESRALLDVVRDSL